MNQPSTIYMYRSKDALSLNKTSARFGSTLAYDSNQTTTGVGTLSPGGGSVAIWYAFQRQMCTMVAGAPNGCAPNVVCFAPGILAALVGLGLVSYGVRRGKDATAATAEA